MSKLRVCFTQIFFPVSIGRYFERALRRRQEAGDIELITVGPLFFTKNRYGLNTGLSRLPYISLPKPIYSISVRFQYLYLSFILLSPIWEAMPVIAVAINNNVMIWQEKVHYCYTAQGDLLLVVTVLFNQLLFNSYLNRGVARFLKIAFSSVDTPTPVRATFRCIVHIGIEGYKVNRLAYITDLHYIMNLVFLYIQKPFKIKLFGHKNFLLIIRLDSLGGLFSSLCMVGAVSTRKSLYPNHFITSRIFTLLSLIFLQAKLHPTGITIFPVTSFVPTAVVALESTLVTILGEFVVVKHLIATTTGICRHISSKTKDLRRLAALLSKQHPINLWRSRINEKSARLGYVASTRDIIAQIGVISNASCT